MDGNDQKQSKTFSMQDSAEHYERNQTGKYRKAGMVNWQTGTCADSHQPATRVAKPKGDRDPANQQTQ